MLNNPRPGPALRNVLHLSVNKMDAYRVTNLHAILHELRRYSH